MSEKQELTGTPEYDDLIRIQREAKEAIEKAGQKAVAALFKNFFATHSEVTGVAWTQYAPHFNDGEPCEFSIHDCNWTTRGDIDFEKLDHVYEDEDGWCSSWSSKGLDQRQREILEAVKTLRRASDDDVFKAAFGSDSLVIATPTGFHVNEYEHE